MVPRLIRRLAYLIRQRQIDADLATTRFLRVATEDSMTTTRIRKSAALRADRVKRTGSWRDGRSEI